MRAAISRFGLKSLSSLRRGTESVQAAACRPEELSKKDEALLEAFARELPGALGLTPERIILVFDSDRRVLVPGKHDGAAVGLPATRHARQCPAQGNRRASWHARHRQLPGVPAPRRRGAGTGGSFAGRSTLEFSRSPAHGAGSGARHGPLKQRNASRQQISDSLLNCAPFRRRPGSARRPGTPGTGEGGGIKRPSTHQNWSGSSVG